MKKLVRTFFYKDGKISKTSIFLTIATFLTLLLWPFQALFVGAEFGGWWTVPAFDATSAVTILFTLSTLYVANHKLTGQREEVSPQQMETLRTQVGDWVGAVQGDSNGGN